MFWPQTHMVAPKNRALQCQALSYRGWPDGLESRWVMTVIQLNRGSQSRKRTPGSARHSNNKGRIMNSRNKSLRSIFFGTCHSPAVLLSFPSLAMANGMHPEVPLLDTERQSGCRKRLCRCRPCKHAVETAMIPSYIMLGSDHADAGAGQTGAWQYQRT